ncbi:hypothetical protein [Actinospica robiniae]|uniref:hypothetical protein n=1 Tax=Actinospica robiniae TaxID=304901 RepID=UPI00040BE6F4|nr:hypothetical protein [Actinospica robiniae]
MSIGANVSVITVGAILAFAVRVRMQVLSVHTVGAVLMAVGVVGLILQIRALSRQRELTSAQIAQPAEAVLVRPAGSARPPGFAGSTTDPVAPAQSPYRSVEEYEGNEW